MERMNLCPDNAFADLLAIKGPPPLAALLPAPKRWSTKRPALMTKAREENRELNDTEGPEFDRMDGEREKLIGAA
jgi:hypothetical protein